MISALFSEALQLALPRTHDLHMVRELFCKDEMGIR